MTITINLPPETEQKLRQFAAETGDTVEVFVQRLMERVVQRGNGDAHAAHPDKTFDEVLASVRGGFQESGMSNEEVDALFDDTLRHIRQAKRRARPQ